MTTTHTDRPVDKRDEATRKADFLAEGNRIRRQDALAAMERDADERQAVSELLTATDCPTYPCDACRYKRDCEYSDA